LLLVDEASNAGADVVKFQSFSATALASPDTPKVPYQRAGAEHESHAEMLARLELSERDMIRIQAHCEARGVEFMSTPYGIREVEFLNSIGMRRFKVASADIVDEPLHSAIAATGRPCIASTGMASRTEVERVVAIYRGADVELTLLHTTSAYPTPLPDANMRHLVELAADHGCSVGFSDHTQTNVAAVMAVALGARVVEKHLTLDRNDTGPDHRASADPGQFAAYVKCIRDAEVAWGVGGYFRNPAEEQMARTSRKSLHAVKSLPVGHVLEPADVVLRRPGTGYMWRDLPTLASRRTEVGIEAGDMLEPRHFGL
jgi:sialic acid synthase SpsE